MTFEAQLHYILKSEEPSLLVMHRIPIKAPSRKEAYQKALAAASTTIDEHNFKESVSERMEYLGISSLDLSLDHSSESTTRQLENEHELLKLIQKLRVKNLNLQEDLAEATI